ncbi:response regulator, partial [Bacteroidia bacterium]|nr:response regulator [Bacteroidia bacterium]
MKIKAIHIDDEKDSIEVIQMLIKEHCPQLDLVAWAHTVNEGVELIEKHNPHLVFLDVEMPGENGFSLFSKLKHRSFHTIMVTGYENYAIKAMKHSALDYLLKPVDADSLESAVSKLDSKNLLEDPRLAHFNSLYQNELATIKSLMIMTQSGFKNILFKNIVFIKSESGGY